ncbi:uncharacterized protein LOC119370245 [Jatropha curcas]|uniref:uncharacterized protein LOC119370245 n=1 Tax=Jatropha curcas TaxID=180498 RepID=UPI001894CC14|nr:uncharacterized protein LOC119370245 [Jatropha curcas]
MTTQEERKGFIGYLRGTKGGLFYSPKDKKTIVSTNAHYLKEDYILNHIPKSQLALRELRGDTILTDTFPKEHEPEPFTVGVDIPLPHRSGRNSNTQSDQHTILDLPLQPQSSESDVNLHTQQVEPIDISLPTGIEGNVEEAPKPN